MEVQTGKVTHFYNKISVAVLELTGDLKLGDMIHILGFITDYDQQVTSMEINHQKIQTAGAGMEIALKVTEMVRRGDVVYRYEGSQD